MTEREQAEARGRAAHEVAVQPQVSAGATEAARILFWGGPTKASHLEFDAVPEIARIIERETHCGELLEALEKCARWMEQYSPALCSDSLASARAAIGKTRCGK